MMSQLSSKTWTEACEIVSVSEVVKEDHETNRGPVLLNREAAHSRKSYIEFAILYQRVDVSQNNQ